ncbi:MAG: DUF3135 domain-containing protein [Gammaproteobacteria bacterium]|nr:DUF3135 domain-containing protein [Gammaproteobacteria bacterium]
MQKKSFTTLDFDEAVALARNNPEAFEQYRIDAIEALIACSSTKNQQHLRRLQWRIDQERKRAPNPTAACVKIYQMMWETFTRSSGFIDIICNGNYPLQNADDTTPKAKVLSLSDVREKSKNSE